MKYVSSVLRSFVCFLFVCLARGDRRECVGYHPSHFLIFSFSPLSDLSLPLLHTLFFFCQAP